MLVLCVLQITSNILNCVVCKLIIGRGFKCFLTIRHSNYFFLSQGKLTTWESLLSWEANYTLYCRHNQLKVPTCYWKTFLGPPLTSSGSQVGFFCLFSFVYVIKHIIYTFTPHLHSCQSIEKVYPAEKSFIRLIHVYLRLFIKSAPTFQPPNYSGSETRSVNVNVKWRRGILGTHVERWSDDHLSFLRVQIHSKSIDWFLYDYGLRHESVKLYS